MEIDIERIRHRIKNTAPSKSNPMYSSHLYWSQKSYNICDLLIEELSEPGSSIYDPFLGSGVTVLESVRKPYSRTAYGCEINEGPLLIVKTLLKKHDLSTYHKDATKLIKELKELYSYYETDCPVCGGVGITTTTIFDLEDRHSIPKIKKINYTCPNCKRKNKDATKEDLAKLRKKGNISNIADIPLHENSKLAVYKNERIEEIFTPRNYTVMDQILGMIKKYPKSEETFRYVLMSIIHLAKITDTHSNSQWPLWIPKKDCVEKNIVDIFINRLKKFEATITYLNENYDEKCKYKLFHKGSQFISNSDIPDKSISLIITDPPYLGQVAYSEYMQLYKPFLGLNYNMDDEIIVTSTPDRKRTEEEYFNMLEQVFEICSKKIVDGGYFCMYFHDSNLSVWNRLVRIMERNSFKYLFQEHIHKTSTLKNIISPKRSLSGDAILVFVKEKFKYKDYNNSESMDEIEANIVKHIKGVITQEGEKSTPELYDEGLIEYLIYNNWLEPISKKYKTLVELFEKHLLWNKDSGKWYLA